MVKVITIGNEKGGVGKTTLATHIAGYMAAYHGLRVLFIDFAPQGHATISFGLKKTGAIYDWLVRSAPVTDVIKSVTGEHVSLPNKEFTGELYVIPGNSETVSVPNQVPSHVLLDAIEEVRSLVDLVIMDIDPATSALSTLIYMASDAIVMPTQVEKLALDGIVSTHNSILRFQKHFTRRVEIAGIIPNFFDSRRSLHNQNLAQLMKFAQRKEWQVWSPVRNLTAFGDASNRQRMVYSIEGDRSADAATLDLIRVANQFHAAVVKNA